MDNQKTITRVVKTQGFGIFSGKNINLTLSPADVDNGIVFNVGSHSIQAKNKNTNVNKLTTQLVNNVIVISTVEHMMSALSGMEIDNINIELNTNELPIMDGSASDFVDLIKSAGIFEQRKLKKFIKINKIIRIELDDGAWAQVSPHNGFKLSVEIDFDHLAVQNSNQKICVELNKKTYEKELCLARTFGYIEEIKELIRSGFFANIKLKDALNFFIGLEDNGKVSNKEKLRYKDEFVRHKTLDAVGDLYLLGYSMVGHYQSCKPSHKLNHQLVSEILKRKDAYEIVSQ
jgi:UDP-3-O-[3-hydroxymyristoyl] N-acetylglucosamine deacetylase